MEINWQYIQNSPTRCMALCANDGEKIFKIFAKIHRLDTGAWAYSCSSEVWAGPGFYLGTEPNRENAMKTVENGVDNQVINKRKLNMR